MVAHVSTPSSGHLLTLLCDSLILRQAFPVTAKIVPSTLRYARPGLSISMERTSISQLSQHHWSYVGHVPVSLLSLSSDSYQIPDLTPPLSSKGSAHYNARGLR